MNRSTSQLSKTLESTGGGQDEILEISQSSVSIPQGEGRKFGDIGKLLSTATAISKFKTNFLANVKDNVANQQDIKNITESYMIEQIILMTEFCYSLRDFDKQVQNADSLKQRQQIEEQRDMQVKELFVSLQEDQVIEFLQKGNYEIEILQDILDICLVIFNEFMLKDQYIYQESPLCSLFSFLQQLTLLPEAQNLLLNSKTFYELSSKFTKKSIKDLTFWQRELEFIAIISNIVSYQEITDFTSVMFLQYAEILIQFYDFIQKNHSKVIEQRQKETKRKDIERTPKFLQEEGKEQIRIYLALLPAYLVEFSAFTKYSFTLNFDSLSNDKKLGSTSQQKLQKQYTKIAILCRMCLDSIEKNELSKALGEIVTKMKEMLPISCSIIKRMILAFFKYYVKTNDMRCWFKFSSPHLAIDSTNTVQNVITIGNPYYFGNQIGLYSNWGAFFDEGDVIYLKDRIKFDQTSQTRSYSISLWFIYPFRTLNEYLNPDETTFIDIAAQSSTPINRQQRKVIKNFRCFLQCESGNGCILGILNEQKVVFFDDEFRMHSFDMVNKSEGWNNIILSVDNMTQNVKIYMNSKEISNKFNVTISRNVAFIGNSIQKTEPCGTICDLRFFDSIIPDELKDKIVHYNRIQNMPDFLYFDLEQFGVCEAIDQALEKNKKDDRFIQDIVKCIICLTTNQYTKGKLIAQGVFNKIVPLTFHKSYETRLLSQKALLYFY
ncbi:hypothetical protein ABPG72_012281 [Tetrahymena utriculariae]